MLEDQFRSADSVTSHSHYDGKPLPWTRYHAGSHFAFLPVGVDGRTIDPSDLGQPEGLCSS